MAERDPSIEMGGQPGAGDLDGVPGDPAWSDSSRLKAALTSLRPALPWLLLLIVAFGLFAWQIQTNPPGYYLDEASISFNAYSISLDGRDEHGVAWPLFFQTWDASVAVNPTYVYLLAVVFKLFGPSIIAARLLSVVVGFAGAIVLGLLARRMTGSRTVGWFIAGSALVTPWLFEASRLVFEVALFPLVLACFLLVLHRAHRKQAWTAAEIVAIAGLLGLLTYTYSIGRLLGPMLAFGLVLFASRPRFRFIVATWFLYGLTLVPALIFNVSSDGAISARAGLLGYFTPAMSVIDMGAAFVSHVLANLDLQRILLTGDPNIRHHVPVMGGILAGTLLVAVVGLDRLAHRGWRDPWNRYLLYGLLASLVPASLTIDEFHTLRLIAFPTFLLLFAAIGLARLEAEPAWGRRAVIGLVALTVVQALVFQVQFQRDGPNRGGAFDAAFPEVFDAALAAGSSPIYLRDRGDLPGYVEAYWYGALRGMDRTSFVRLKSDEVPPAGAVVLGTDKTCGACQVLAEGGDYIAYRAGESTAEGLIPNGDFEEVGSTPLDTFGASIFGWSTSPNTALRPGGARSEGAHLALGHVTDTTTTKEANSTAVAITGGTSVALEAFVRAAQANRSHVNVTIALVELDENHEFVTWHTKTLELSPSGAWQQERMAPIQVNPKTAYVNVSSYLEPGGSPNDEVEIDDIVVDYLG
jgi:4-amino-4-deoxy-L-arabinose transferase-like glycosyltransferase